MSRRVSALGGGGGGGGGEEAFKVPGFCVLGVIWILEVQITRKSQKARETNGLYDLLTRGDGVRAGGVFTAWREELARRHCKGVVVALAAALARRRVGTFIEGASCGNWRN